MILVYGGSGFIGRHVATALRTRGGDVVVTSLHVATAPSLRFPVYNIGSG